MSISPISLTVVPTGPLSGSRETIVMGVADALGNDDIKNVAVSIATMTTVSFIRLDDKASPPIWV